MFSGLEQPLWPTTRIIYIHVPKCGGSSFGAALRLRYFGSSGVISLNQGGGGRSKEEQIESDYIARGAQLRHFVEVRKRLIVGHVRYDRALHSGPAQDYKFVTLLRDPIERFVSHYNYLQRHHPDPARPNTLDAFIETADARRLASQYLYYFAGVSQDQAPDLAKAITLAQSNLSRFDLVGHLNAPGDFADDLSRLMRLPIMKWRRNVAPQPTQVPAYLRGPIQKICAPDIAIYQHIRAVQARAA